jgi:hypothetical protein
VKPLEWTQVPDKWLQFTAGDYTVRAGCWYYRDAYKGQTANEDTAKAKAQADYTARILSALDASALAAAAEREAALVEKVRQSALDYLALDMQATEALEREAALVKEIERLRSVARWNVEEDGTLVHVCHDLHEKGEKCEFARYVPEARVTAAEAERARLEALLIEAKDHIAHNAPSLSMQSPDYLLVSRIVAAIRKETTA